MSFVTHLCWWLVAAFLIVLFFVASFKVSDTTHSMQMKARMAAAADECAALADRGALLVVINGEPECLQEAGK